MGAFTQKAKVQFALKCQKFARFQRRKPCKSGFKQIFLTYNYAKQVNATRNKVCKVCKQQMQLFFKLVVQVAVFFNGVSKEKCVQIFVPCKVALFLQEGSQVFERACFQQPYYDKLFFKLVVQVAVFFNGVSKGQCVQILCPALCTFPTRVFTSF